MDPTDTTIEILKSIRDGVRETNARIDQTNARLDRSHEGTNERLDGLTRRVVESEIRTSTAIVDLHGTVRELVDVLRAQQEVRPRLDRAERDISEIKQRLGM